MLYGAGSDHAALLLANDAAGLKAAIKASVGMRDLVYALNHGADSYQEAISCVRLVSCPVD